MNITQIVGQTKFLIQEANWKVQFKQMYTNHPVQHIFPLLYTQTNRPSSITIKEWSVCVTSTLNITSNKPPLDPLSVRVDLLRWGYDMFMLTLGWRLESRFRRTPKMKWETNKSDKNHLNDILFWNLSTLWGFKINVSSTRLAHKPHTMANLICDFRLF